MLDLLSFWTVLEASVFLFLPASLIKGMIVELFFLFIHKEPVKVM